jgi:hypothetical protein
MAKQSGFHVLEIGLFVIIIVVVGAVGWSVYQSKNKADKSKNSTPAAQVLYGPRSTKLPTDWTWFESKDKAIKFAYPKGWGTIPQPNQAGNGIITSTSIDNAGGYKAWLNASAKWIVWHPDSRQMFLATDSNPPSDKSNHKPGNLKETGPVTNLDFGDSNIRLIINKENVPIYEMFVGSDQSCDGHKIIFPAKDKIVTLQTELCDAEDVPDQSVPNESIVTNQIPEFYKYIQ